VFWCFGGKKIQATKTPKHKIPPNLLIFQNENKGDFDFYLYER
jgi:hypothetical protein